jgi:hypothetical protein
MKKYLILLVLICSQSFASKENVLIKDKVVFKAATEVFTLSELKSYFQSFQDMSCFYPDSLLTKIFSIELKDTKVANLDYSDVFTVNQKVYFVKILKFAKLLVYSRSHDVVLNNALNRYFYSIAKSKQCYAGSFDENKEFNFFAKELMKLEIFMRSRFLPEEKSGKVTSKEYLKAVNGARALIKSLDKQIDEEVYW